MRGSEDVVPVPACSILRNCFLAGIDGRKQVGIAEFLVRLVRVYACKI